MPYYSNYSSDECFSDAVIIDRSPELFDLFRSRRKAKIVRIVEETPVRRGGSEYVREDRTRDYSPSPPRASRTTRLMTEEDQAGGFVPLPAVIERQRPYSSDSDEGSVIIEDREPRRKPSKKKPKIYQHHRRRDSGRGSGGHEYIEVPPSPLRRETDAERARRKQAEYDAGRERQRAEEAEFQAAHNASTARAEQRRRQEMENMTQQLRDAFIDERDGHRNATREAERAQAAAQALAQELERSERQNRMMAREREVLERERRVAEAERERAEAAAAAAAAAARDRPRRPVDLFQEPRPLDRDPGTDAIRRAQEHARRRQQQQRDEEADFAHQRDQRRGRRISPIIYDDDSLRRGRRRP